jgi:hypothetical protein
MHSTTNESLSGLVEDPPPYGGLSAITGAPFTGAGCLPRVAVTRTHKYQPGPAGVFSPSKTWRCLLLFSSLRARPGVFGSTLRLMPACFGTAYGEWRSHKSVALSIATNPWSRATTNKALAYRTHGQ